MSLYGALRLLGPLDAPAFLVDAENHLPWDETLKPSGVVPTNPESPEFHQPLALFTAAGLRTAVAEAGFTLERLATANRAIDDATSCSLLPSAAPGAPTHSAGGVTEGHLGTLKR